ncbi:MAG: hypothetical protein WBN04_20520 [Paracoccaceae bacterium]
MDNPILSQGWIPSLEVVFYLVMASALVLPVRPAVRLAYLAVVLCGLTLSRGLVPAEGYPRLMFYTTSLRIEFLIGAGLGALWHRGLIPSQTPQPILRLSRCCCFC